MSSNRFETGFRVFNSGFPVGQNRAVYTRIIPVPCASPSSGVTWVDFQHKMRFCALWYHRPERYIRYKYLSLYHQCEDLLGARALIGGRENELARTGTATYTRNLDGIRQLNCSSHRIRRQTCSIWGNMTSDFVVGYLVGHNRLVYDLHNIRSMESSTEATGEESSIHILGNLRSDIWSQEKSDWVLKKSNLLNQGHS